MTVIVPFSLDEAVRAVAEHPDAVVLAGGTDLMVEVNDGRRRLGPGTPGPTVVAVDRVAELRTWSLDPVRNELTIGAAVTYTELLAEPLASLLPALAQAARTVGSPQIRNAGTVGGNVVTCSPAGDTLPVLSALDATVELASPGSVRSLPVHDFMLGVKRTALARGELVTAVTVPILTGWQGFAKVGVRNAMVIATASACVATDLPSRSIRIALGSVAPTVIRCHDAETFARDTVDWTRGSITLEHARGVAARAADASRPIDDHRSTAAYRRHAVSVLVRRLLLRAFPDGAGR